MGGPSVVERMMASGQPPEEPILTRVIRLNAVVAATATGIFTGLVVFAATNWLILKGGPRVGPHLALLGQFFIGYTVTFVGSLIGLSEGFAFGFLIGFFIAVVYNRFADLRHRRPRGHA
jgi:hypothetical protein